MHTAASLRLQECAGCCRSLVRATASGEVEQPARAALLTRCWMFRLLPFMLKAAAATVESGLFDSYMRRILRQGMSALYRRPYRVTTDSKHDKPIAANILNRRFDGWQINRAWVGDVTAA